MRSFWVAAAALAFLCVYSLALNYEQDIHIQELERSSNDLLEALAKQQCAPTGSEDTRNCIDTQIELNRRRYMLRQGLPSKELTQ